MTKAELELMELTWSERWRAEHHTMMQLWADALERGMLDLAAVYRDAIDTIRYRAQCDAAASIPRCRCVIVHA
jgi:hypothetical protein